MNVSLIIPSRNNLKYVVAAYESIRRNIGYQPEIIILDDASTDGTYEWAKEIHVEDSNTQIYKNRGPERVGHTVLYDVGAQMASNEIFGIFHADMFATPNYIKNMVKHLKRGTVVSATRVEPPLHPPGPEKYVVDFGMEPETFREADFLRFVYGAEDTQGNKDKTTAGIFAPWMMYKEDFFAIGGHDKRVFAPMELEDSDLFNRFLLKGYTLIQSRDALVYHMTCRGSRFKDGIKIVQQIPVGGGNIWNRVQDSDEYTALRNIKFREWWRKWHMDVLHDSNMLPIVHPRYNVGFQLENASMGALEHFEPWCDTIYVTDKSLIVDYIAKEQPRTKFDMQRRVKNSFEIAGTNDVVVTFDVFKFKPHHMDFIKQLPLILKDSGEIGVMEHDIFKLTISALTDYSEKLVHSDEQWYLNKLK